MRTNRYLDLRLLTGFILAHVLIYFSFHDKTIFWYIFSGSILVLIAFSMFQGDVDDEASFLQYIFLGVFSGSLLYFILWLGLGTFEFFHLPFSKGVNSLYHWFAPALFWEYLALILVAAPGEEIFWRGFVQKRLMRNFGPIGSILLSSVLYASVNIYSMSYLLVLAAFVSGVFWGTLYYWRKSMPLVIVSHIVFDILMFILLPLK